MSREEIVQAIDQVNPTGKSGYTKIRHIYKYTDIHIFMYTYLIIALHFACESGSMECVVTLLEQGADSNLFDKSRYTPLSLVCKNGHASCVQPVRPIMFINQSNHPSKPSIHL